MKDNELTERQLEQLEVFKKILQNSQPFVVVSCSLIDEHIKISTNVKNKALRNDFIKEVLRDDLEDFKK